MISHPSTSPVPATSRSMTVLVVDDDYGFRELIRLALTTTTKWNVVTAADAADARTVLGSLRADVLLTDERMPGEQGSELVRSLFEQGALHSMTAILVTGTSHLMPIRGLSGHICKPFDPVTLGERVAQLVEEGVRRRRALRTV
jgi:two-component system phosphate regulon response regulator OmpR